MQMFFDGWGRLGPSLVLAVLAYAALVIMLRLSQKRTLSKMNVFDFVFVVALGSTLATTILSSDVSLADGLVAFGALMGLQILLSWLCVTSHRVDSFVNGEPSLIFHDGNFLKDAMRRERVTKEEMPSATRSQGVADLGDVDSIVLETNGQISIVLKSEGRLRRSSMEDVEGHPTYRSDEQHG
jgi:uncharacterized membrane protein YcaP (DUF421 family)